MRKLPLIPLLALATVALLLFPGFLGLAEGMPTAQGAPLHRPAPSAHPLTSVPTPNRVLAHPEPLAPKIAPILQAHPRVAPSPGSRLACQTQNLGGSLVISVSLSNACEWTNGTLGVGSSTDIIVPEPLTLEGGGTVVIGAGVVVELYDTLSVTDGTSLIFGGSDTLQIKGTGASLQVLSSSKILLNRSILTMDGGEIHVADSSLIGNANATLLTLPTVQDVNLSSMGLPGVLNFSGSYLQWVNVTHGTYSVSITGSFAKLVSVDHFNTGNATLTSFVADDAILGNISMGLVDNLTLGNPFTSSNDRVVVGNLLVNQVNYTITFAHATVDVLHWSGARSATIVGSTFSSLASTITDVSSTFTAVAGSNFSFPMDFSGSAIVKLVNVTAPNLILSGETTAAIYNWPGNTSISANGVAELPSIQVTNQSAYAQVYRYLIVTVQGVGGSGSLPPVSTVVSFSPESSYTASGPEYPLPSSSSTLALYLPTDNVTSADTFSGAYTIRASAPGASASTTLNVLSDNQKIVLALSPDAVQPMFSLPYLIAEIAALVAAVAGSVYLFLRIRHLRNGNAPTPPKEEEKIHVPT